MDPNKSPSAPPAGWNAGEKSAMGTSAPPPYQDHPQYPNAGCPQYPTAGYPQPAPGYPPAQGFGAPPQGYGAPPQGYGAPPQGYGAPPQGYGAPPQYAYGQQAYPAPAQYAAQPGSASVTVQPTVFVTRAPLAHPVNDYMGYSIFTLLCCCLPLGIAALIYSISARDANLSGDQISAERNSRTARILNHVSLGIGITVFALSMVFVGVIGF